MCRLYGQISAKPASAADYLAQTDRSLLRQSDKRPQNLQKDGWGLAYFDGAKPKVIKSPLPVFEEGDRFTNLASQVRSRVVIGHIRAASNPKGVAASSLISKANTQPFTDGIWAFAHNGTLEIPDEIASRLGAYRDRLRGLNDSEVFFWQLRKFIDARAGDVPAALEDCVDETWAAWRDCRARYPKKRSPYTGLNVLLSDGVSLHALCHYPAFPAQKALCSPGQCWGRMSLGRRAGRVVVASEDMDAGPWRRLGDPEIVSAAIAGGRVSVRRRRLRTRGSKA